MDISTLGEDLLKVVLKGVILRLKKHYTSEVDNGLDEAFQLALADWSKHTPTTSDKVRLSKALEEYIQSSASYKALDADTRTFIDCFKKRLSEQPAAHNYLMTLRADMQAKDQEQNLLEHHKTQELIQGLMAQLGGLNMSPQDIQALLKELPLEQGLERTESALEEMCSKGRISSVGVKQIVLEFVRFLFEHTDKISEEVKRLREAGDSYLAETLEDIKRVLTGESEQSLTAVYEKHQEQAKQNEIRVLKELIKAAQIQFSFGEARKFYERLIELAPTSEHHFNYARLLYSLNDFKIARKYYEKALRMYRKLSEQNPEAYMPNIATTLNNLGILLKNTNELEQARTYYEEALEIRRELSEQNPEAYKPAVARSLNNLGILLKDTNELEKARTCYKEALAIRRELSKQNPEAYMPDVATSLNDLGLLLQYTNELEQAQAYYEEALQIRRNLADQNPEAYNPKVATTLNNLVSLYVGLKKIEEAEKAYQEVHDIYQELAGKYPRAYETNYAKILVIGFALLSKPNEDLDEAKAILDKYPEHPKAQELLSIIEQLDKR